MIITLLTIGIIIGTLACFYIASKTYDDLLFGTGVLLMFVSIFSAIFVFAGIIDAHVNSDVKYQNKLYEREMLEYRIEHIEENITGNEMLYKDIVEFNNELRDAKKCANSLWTNWFYNQDIAAMDYIEFDMH